MDISAVDGLILKKMLDAGLNLLGERYREVDSMNVFPVPDGDTGINMYLTLTAAVEGVSGVKNPVSIGEVSEAASKGALMGARGNSGVILSQFLRGLAKGLKDMKDVSPEIFAESIELGVKLAFQAVIKPVEGTILTVAREAAFEAVKTARQNKSLIEVLERAGISAEETLNRTPEMLPVLKEAGVVDAGGMGWLIILQGFKAGLVGKDLEENKSLGVSAPVLKKGEPSALDLKYPYCTEVLVNSKNSDTGKLRDALRNLGDSLMVVASEEFTRVHVHTNHPGQVLEECLKYGSLSKVTISNMIEQAAAAGENSPPAASRKPVAIVSVVMGKGLKEIMESLGADKVVYGGQTMNPSTGDLLNAVEEANADTVIILPNNGNILLTAGQVSDLTKVRIEVVRTKTIPQGIAALLSVMPGNNLEKTIVGMEQAAQDIKTGEITYAARDSVINGININEGDMIGLRDDEIVAAGQDITDVTLELIDKLTTDGGEICSVYYGQDVTSQQAHDLINLLEGKHPDLEFELHSGNQPFYYYIISVE